MTKIKRLIGILVLGCFLGMALYVAVYFMARHSEAFQLIEQRIRDSQVIRTEVGGEINYVRPSFFGPYDQKSVGSDEWVSMRVEVAGSSKSMQLDVIAGKERGQWTVESIKHADRVLD